MVLLCKQKILLDHYVAILMYAKHVFSIKNNTLVRQAPGWHEQMLVSGTVAKPQLFTR